MSMGVWGAMAGLGQGMSQFAGFMYEDRKQQQLQKWRSKEAQKERDWREYQSELDREQRAKEVKFNQDMAQSQNAIQHANFLLNQEQRAKQMELLDLNLREANIKINRTEQLDQAFQEYLDATPEQLPAAYEKYRRQLGSAAEPKYKLQVMKIFDDMGNQIGEEYGSFNERTGVLSPVSMGGQTRPPQAAINALLQNLDDPQAVSLFTQDYGDPRAVPEIAQAIEQMQRNLGPSRNQQLMQDVMGDGQLPGGFPIFSGIGRVMGERIFDAPTSGLRRQGILGSGRR